MIYKIRGRHVLVNNVCTPERRERDVLELWISNDNCANWSKKLPLARLNKENPNTWDGFWDGGETLPQAAYPHGFADDGERNCTWRSFGPGNFSSSKFRISDLL